MLTHKGTATLESERLILRKPRVEDAEAMYRNWASDPEVTKYLTWPTHASAELTAKLLEGWAKEAEKETYYQWMIVPKDGKDEPIGSFLANLKDERVGCFHLGYCIGKAWWHQGLMTEAVRTVMEFLFCQVGANKVEARHDPNNPHSGDVMRKCGMTYEGTLRQCDWNNQGICDTSYYGILRDEYFQTVGR